jgi:hypothetical protein
METAVGVHQWMNGKRNCGVLHNGILLGLKKGRKILPFVTT